ncbi:MAG: 50S ribosomal protein L24 [Candidatus Abyssobacteria bacterium SURF_5]|uniref:Large ribosomal subunit protein uL24 n=1 Tax=Abyssobacteria bacterium (strain SURF_5) TaxID=2093360 RepID=A0A3A4NM96_ABYX5|nr:MAG: 50S ribosomal protein L24 [Candidatus Abyssubacteria bacterium SURF_5]
MSKTKMHLKRGDNVMVIAGKEKGKRGKILHVSPVKNRAIVEALNMVTHHERPSRTNPQGGLLQKEAPIHVSNLMLVCPKCSTPTRVGRTVLDDGTKARVCKNCSEMVDQG